MDSSYFTKEHSRGKETHLLAPPGLRYSGRVHKGYPHPPMTHTHSLSTGCHTQSRMYVCNSTEEGIISIPRLWTRTPSCSDTMSHNMLTCKKQAGLGSELRDWAGNRGALCCGRFICFPPCRVREGAGGDKKTGSWAYR